LSYFGIAHVIVNESAPRFGSRSTCVVLFGKIVLSRDDTRRITQRTQTMTLQRIETQLADARKQLDRAIAQRDAAISGIIKSSDKIKAAQRTLARLEKRRRETRAEEQAARKATAKRTAEDGPIPAL
jgi:septal ring factor EnvC (AmiA/AmiB activator)